MTDLFLWAGGAALRDAGMRAASDAQESDAPGWHDRAYSAIVAVARKQSEVHVDDVLTLFHEQPMHFNAWGSMWQRALKDGVIAKTGRLRETRDRRKRRHQYPVYRSLL